MCVCDALIVLSNLIIYCYVPIVKKQFPLYYILNSCNGKMDLSLQRM